MRLELIDPASIYKIYQILASVHNLIRFLVSGCKVKNSLHNNQTKYGKSFKFLILYQGRDIGPQFLKYTQTLIFAL